MKDYWIIIAVDYLNACAPVMHGSPDFLAMLDDGVSSDIMLDAFDNQLSWGNHDFSKMVPGLYKLRLDWVVDTNQYDEIEAYFAVNNVELMLEFPNAN